MGKVVSHLKNIFCPLQYTTQQCKCCSFTDFTDNTWYYCSQCGNPICKDCYIDHGEYPDIVVCEECASFIDCPSIDYSGIRLIPDDFLSLSPDISFESSGPKIIIDYTDST